MKKFILLVALALCTIGVFGANGVANAQPGGWYDAGQPYYPNMSPEAQAAMQKHWNTVGPLQQQVFAKEAELEAMIAGGANEAEINSAAKQLDALSSKLNAAQVRMDQELAQQGVPYGGGPRGGYGYGYRGGRAYGGGRGGWGYGGSCCWW